METFLEQLSWTLLGTQDSTMLDLDYNVLSDKKIKNKPIDLIQYEGFLFMWVTNGKPNLALDFIQLHGYRWVETVVWVNLDKNGNVFKGPGRYLQHGMEQCLVGVKGKYYEIKSSQSLDKD
ncbi:MT-A70 family protein [Oxytricha trifallax]|uniref:mRNA m(6)A methyltransferase n=1 Tax=Oxytricha trifallax TaxID=1172189 RepID=A0A073HZD3_9SPIT|nr:MT-A70 family protein [Oxytricha trifallax]